MHSTADLCLVTPTKWNIKKNKSRKYKMATKQQKKEEFSDAEAEVLLTHVYMNKKYYLAAYPADSQHRKRPNYAKKLWR